MGRPSLVGTAARTAVIAGTATAVVGSVSSSQQQAAQNKAIAQQAQLDAAVQQAVDQQQATAPAQPPAAPAAPAAGATEDKIAQLQKLAELKASGVLSEAEFEVMKANVLIS